jgi:hypothetical protein
MQIIEIEGKAYNFPTCWDDLKKKDIPDMIELVFLRGETGQTYHELLRIAMGATSLQYAQFCKRHFSKTLPEKVREANGVVLHELFMQLAWVYEQPMNILPFESYNHNYTEYILPDPDFYAITFAELSDAYIHMQAYVKQVIAGDERLNLLVATLCRPKRQGEMTPDWNGDHREPYNEFISKERSKEVAKWPDVIKVAVLIYYAACLQKMLGGYDIGGDSSGGEEDYIGQGFIKNQHLLANGIYGTLDNVKKANAHEVLLALHENKKDAIEARKRQKDDN